MGETSNGKWVAIEPNSWKPEKEGDSVEGVLVHKKERDGELSPQFFLETENEGQVLVWGSAIITQRMEYIKIGEKVRVTYLEMSKNKKGQPLKLFKVEHWEEDADIDVT